MRTDSRPAGAVPRRPSLGAYAIASAPRRLRHRNPAPRRSYGARIAARARRTHGLPPAWTTDCARGDDDVIPSSTPAAVSGYPSLSVPAGFVGELPVGLLLTAGDRQDAELLTLGAAVEGRLDAWRAPRYLPSVGPAE